MRNFHVGAKIYHHYNRFILLKPSVTVGTKFSTGSGPNFTTVNAGLAVIIWMIIYCKVSFTSKSKHRQDDYLSAVSEGLQIKCSVLSTYKFMFR